MVGSSFNTVESINGIDESSINIHSLRTMCSEVISRARVQRWEIIRADMAEA